MASFSLESAAVPPVFSLPVVSDPNLLLMLQKDHEDLSIRPQEATSARSAAALLTTNAIVTTTHKHDGSEIYVYWSNSRTAADSPSIQTVCAAIKEHILAAAQREHHFAMRGASEINDGGYRPGFPRPTVRISQNMGEMKLTLLIEALRTQFNTISAFATGSFAHALTICRAMYAHDSDDKSTRFDLATGEQIGGDGSQGGPMRQGILPVIVILPKARCGDIGSAFSHSARFIRTTHSSLLNGQNTGNWIQMRALTGLFEGSSPDVDTRFYPVHCVRFLFPSTEALAICANSVDYDEGDDHIAIPRADTETTSRKTRILCDALSVHLGSWHGDTKDTQMFRVHGPNSAARTAASLATAAALQRN